MELLGLLILAPAVLVHVWSFALFLFRGRGTPLPFAPPTQFVTQGPYRYSRNPMALSVICGAAGLSLYLRSPLGLVVSAGLALTLHLWVTRIEEPGLVRRFGEPYVGYCRRVPRWLPGTPAIAVVVSLLLSPLPGCQSASRDESYAPGLGEIMSLTQMRHLKLWFAGRADNWALAAYETDELEEGFSDVVRFHPTHEGSPTPLSRLVPEFTAGPIEALRSAIEHRDPVEFTAAYDSLTRGCNGCHRAAAFSFNVVERPSANPYSNQRFQPPR